MCVRFCSFHALPIHVLLDIAVSIHYPSINISISPVSIRHFCHLVFSSHQVLQLTQRLFFLLCTPPSHCGTTSGRPILCMYACLRFTSRPHFLFLFPSVTTLTSCVPPSPIHARKLTSDPFFSRIRLFHALKTLVVAPFSRGVCVRLVHKWLLARRRWSPNNREITSSRRLPRNPREQRWLLLYPRKTSLFQENSST